MGWPRTSRIASRRRLGSTSILRLGLALGSLIDHGTSVVIGETAVVEDNVSLLHEVTLGGTGKEIG